MGYQFLSFVSAETKKNIGVCIVKADTFDEAIKAAWGKKINPGGEVMGFKLTDIENEDLELDRLYSPEELNAFGYKKVLDL